MLFIFCLRRRNPYSSSHEFTWNFCILTNIIAPCILNNGGRYKKEEKVTGLTFSF